jgi:hypothetical protein
VATDEQIFHLAGLDHLAPAYDRQAYGDDRLLDLETQAERDREQLPQLGPPFVAFVHEHFTRLQRMFLEETRRWSARELTTQIGIASFQTDASGNVKRATHPNSIIIDPNPGWTFAVHRIAVIAVGFTFASPYSNAAAYWELRENDEAIDGGPLTGTPNSIPFVKTWGTRDAPHIRDGLVGSFFLAGTAGIANTSITVKAQYTAIRSAEA